MLATILACVISAVAAIGVYILVTNVIFKKSLKKKREAILKEAEAEGEVIKKEKILQAKEKFIQLKSDHDRAVNERNQKLNQREQGIKQQESSLGQQQQELERRMRENDKLKEQMESHIAVLERRKEEADRMIKEQNVRLEQISGMSSEEAKNILMENMRSEAKTAAMAYINETVEEAKMSANKEAKRIVVQTIQRVATETAIENSVTVFNIESDEVKGRIIGREGRNIRALEAATGIEIIVDDTPEAIILSGFDPVRREIARLALHQLVTDGRIHPARIEEMVEKAKKEVETMIREEGEEAALEVGVHGIHPELIRLLGKMKFRTSYGQNALKHSIEVAHLSGLLAGEVGVDVRMAKRAGLLHDIGKSVDHDMEGSHIQLGAELCRKFKESALVINAVEAHHGDVEAESMIACLVQAADAISAARPGARRETLETYTNRLKQLEDISNSFKGVDKSFAIQAGREVRVMVIPDQINDDEMVLLARDLSKQIEAELQYPGQIKVNVIRESRVVDYAK